MRYLDATALASATFEDLPCFVTTEPPSDLAARLPALVVAVESPAPVGNDAGGDLSAVCTLVLSALASTREAAADLCAQAVGRVFDRRHTVTPYGWINRAEIRQLPVRVRSEFTPARAYQFTASVHVLMRKTP